MQFNQFVTELSADADVIVMVGDLFDHPYVGDAITIRAGDAVLRVAALRPNVRYIMMAGNHDLPRNIMNKGAFDSFEKHVADRVENLHVVRTPQIIHGLAIFPWQWNVTARAQAEKLMGWDREANIGHWDLKSFNEKDDHLCPTDLLGDVPTYSGHYHVAGDYKVGDFVVHCTGSLQPYTHDEDPSGTLYITMTRDEALRCLPEEISGKCVRVILAPGEELPDLVCLALTQLRRGSPKDAPDTGEIITLDTFDWKGILATKVAKLDPVVQEFINDRLPSA